MKTIASAPTGLSVSKFGGYFLDLHDVGLFGVFVFLTFPLTAVASEDFLTPKALAQFWEYWLVAPERKMVMLIPH